MKNFKRVLSAILFLGSLVHMNQAFAVVMASCGPSAGYSYFVDNGMLNKSDVGFQTDGISKGNFQIVQDGDFKNWDVIHIDVTGNQISALADGGSVVMLGGEITGFYLMVNYPKASVEVYTLRPLTKEVNWIKTTNNTMVSKTAVYTSKCIFN